MLATFDDEADAGLPLGSVCEVGLSLEVEGAREALGPGRFSGARRLVDKLKMSLPWTTKLSFDFFRSRVSISSLERQCRL